MTLSTQDNARLLQQLKSGPKRTINWDKYQLDPKMHEEIFKSLSSSKFLRRKWIFCFIF